MDGSSADVDPVVAELKRDVEHHVQEEESETFPRFRKAVGQEILDALGQQVEDAKSQAKASG
jgi:iron-sulfur cluster repair protein YtfE (RIC family)